MMPRDDEVGMPDRNEPPGADELRVFFERRAAAIDNGTADLRDGLRHLAAHDLLGSPELRINFELIRTIAQSDLASAFSLWAHTMALECLAASPSPELRAHATRLRRAEAWGSTAMAPAIKHLAGLGELPVEYCRDGADLVLDGRIPWASNLFDRAVVLVLSARSAEGVPVVVAVDGRDPAVQFGRPLPLLALTATASSTVQLNSARLGPATVISDDFVGYMKTMKPRLLILQTAYCLGLAEAALAAGAAQLARAPAVQRRDHADLAQQFAAVARQADTSLAAMGPTRAAVEVRLRAAQVAQAAVALELRLSGGSGFVIDSPTARRYREVAFLPVQTPTEGQLRTELG
jgi:alkylation response protein AidB-like acyl-CoA dehydrogenase